MAIKIEPDEVEEGAEPWMGSFADIMSLLLGFFMILYSMSTIDDKKFYEMGKSISSSFVKLDQMEDSEVMDENLSMSQKQLKAFQMLVAILNLGDPNSAIRKIAKAYEAHMNKESVKSLSQTKMSELSKSITSDKNLNVINTIFIPSWAVFRPYTSELTTEGEKVLRNLNEILFASRDFLDVQITVHTSTNRHLRTRGIWDPVGISTEHANVLFKKALEHGIPGSMLSVGSSANFKPWLPERSRKGKLIGKNIRGNSRIEVALLAKGS